MEKTDSLYMHGREAALEKLKALNPHIAELCLERIVEGEDDH